MNKHDRRRIDIEGKFILHLRMKGDDLEISRIREMAELPKTLAKLKSAGVNTISELCSVDYGRLKGIVGERKAGFIIHLLGLYDLKTAPSRAITADVTTTEPAGHGEIIL